MIKPGDLVYLKPKADRLIEDYIGLVISCERIPSNYSPKLSSTTLYDVLLTVTNEIMTVSDIYFEVWRIE